MKIFSGKTFVSLILLFALFSCASKKDLVYLQDVDSSANSSASSNFEPILQPDDLLSIIVSAETPEVTIPFNLPSIQGNYQIGNNQNGIKTYLIDSFGSIEFPVIGKIKLGGLTRSEANAKIVTAVSEYITNPSINLRILNYKVSVIGEVTRPGNYEIASERITLLEALALAGDLTIYGKRDNILLIREVEGKKTFTRIDITKADFIDSPSYYLVQNDVLVVEPNKTKINGSAYGPNLTVIISALSLALTALIVIIR